jgi:hypothetical protein
MGTGTPAARKTKPGSGALATLQLNERSMQPEFAVDRLQFGRFD